MARGLKGIKKPHPLGSVPTRSGVSPLTVVASADSAASSWPGVKISELPAASAANDTDQLEVNQNGTSRRVTVGQLSSAVISGGISGITATGPINATGAGTTWPTTSPGGANWGPRDSHVTSISPGLIGLGGFSRTSDKTVTPETSYSTIGIAGFVIADGGVGESAWAGYLDVQREAGAPVAFGLELAVKNKGNNLTETPYLVQGGAAGIWLAGGGDNSYGGAPVNPSNFAIKIGANDSTWNTGIVFGNAGLTGTDGSDAAAGSGKAISLARTHLLQWYDSSNRVTGSFTSLVTTAGLLQDFAFTDTGLRYRGSGTTRMTVAAADGSISLANAAANLTLGGAANAGVRVDILGQITGAATSYGFRNAATVQSDVSGSANMYYSLPSTEATAFAFPNVTHYSAGFNSLGAGSTITTHRGFVVSSSLATAGSTTVHGFYGGLNAATGVFNLFMQGTADNAIAGKLRVGSSAAPGSTLDVNGILSVTGATITAASTTSIAGLRIPHGAAPTTPTNGEIWTTTAGLFVRINGATVGPLT